MRWGEPGDDRGRRIRIEQDNWMLWWAWRPVFTQNGGWCWLEEVKCKRAAWPNWTDWRYKAIGVYDGE